MDSVVGLIIKSDTENIIDCIKSKHIKEINAYVKETSGEKYEEVERTGVDNIIQDKESLKTLGDYLTNLFYFYEFSSKTIPEYVVLFNNYGENRSEELIDKAIERIRYDSAATSLISVSKTEENPYKTFTIDKNGNLSLVFPSYIKDLFTLSENRFPDTYKANNFIQIFKYTTLKRGSIYGNKIIAFHNL